jgi:hypothetical protein
MCRSERLSYSFLSVPPRRVQGLDPRGRRLAYADRVHEDPSRYAEGQNTRWYLVCYDDEGLRTEFAITRDQLVSIRDMFDRGDDEWMAHCYKVKPDMWPRLIETLGCPPPEASPTYFVEGVANDR